MNLREVMATLNVEFLDGSGHHHCRPGWLQCSCPFCGVGASRYHMGFEANSGRCACWRCGPHNTAVALARLSGQPYNLCKDLLGDLHVERIRPEEVRGKLSLPGGVGDLQGPHRIYLSHRGFKPDEIVKLWGVRGIGKASHLSWRLLIPAYWRGEVVSWTTRSVGDGASRYISAGREEEAVQLKSLLYGEDYARHAVIVHEGPLDVWATGPGAVATLGTSYTRSQLARLSKYPVRAVCFDAEPVAQQRAKRLVADLSSFPGQTFNVVLSTGKDTSRASRDEVLALRKRFLE